ncbi:MAG: primosomal protein N', partial [Planctomycetota bacterium]|nr:primosomal protein N' [Planctomycetota bacterium]
AGRAGRAKEDLGRVIVQTFSPDAPPIRHAAKHDFEGFAEEELALRAAVGLPPVGRMARVVVRDADLAKATAAAKEIAAALRQVAPKEVLLRGPMPCALSRIADMHRLAIEAMAPSAAPIQSMLTAVRNVGLLKSDSRTAVDVDPIALL